MKAAIALVLLVLLWGGAAGAQGAIRVDGAYVPSPPPLVEVAAGYLTVHNEGADPVSIVGASGPCAPSISFHRSIVEGGIARMEPVARFDLAPGEILRFEPGGLHVMLEGVWLEPGTLCRFSLVLDDGSRLEVEAPVRSRATRRSHPHSPGEVP